MILGWLRVFCFNQDEATDASWDTVRFEHLLHKRWYLAEASDANWKGGAKPFHLDEREKENKDKWINICK
jgi:hypothetical protein